MLKFLLSYLAAKGVEHEDRLKVRKLKWRKAKEKLREIKIFKIKVLLAKGKS